MKKRRDNIRGTWWHYLFFILSLLFIVMILTSSGSQYGSKVDWISQHTVFPDYFRKLFYQTGDLFPDFAFHLGAGQNIYNYSYYGLLSPIILVSYIFPMVSMEVFLTAASILSVISSVILLYRWMLTKVDVKVAFMIAILFEFAGPLIYHSHRHIMFILYMPFLIIALMGVDDYFYRKKHGKLIIGTFIVIMINYYFSVGAIMAIVIYAVSVYFEQEEKGVKRFFLEGGKFALHLAIPVLMSAILWLPTLMTLMSRTTETKTTTSFLQLLIPQFQGDAILYGSYALGLSAVFIFAVVYALIFGRKNLKFLGGSFLIGMFIAGITFLLNGKMYVNGKAFIPFLPVAILVVAHFLEATVKKSYCLIGLLSAVGAMTYAIMYTWNSEYKQYYLAEVAITVIILLLYWRFKERKWILYGIVLMAFTSCIQVNKEDTLVSKTAKEVEEDEEVAELIGMVGEQQDTLYRTGTEVDGIESMNKVYDTNYYTTTVYSSISNMGYHDFVSEGIYNEIPYRNYLMISQSHNIFFQMYMGSKHIISKGKAMAGYQQIAQKGEINVYQNNDVFPIGYVTSSIMSQDQYEQLEYPYDMEALVSNAIVPLAQEKEIKSYIHSEAVEELQVKKESDKVTVTLPEEIQDKIVLVRLKVDQKTSAHKSYDGKKDDIKIKINGIQNKRTNPNWRYDNKNEVFEYVISSNQQIEELEMSFSKGTYTIEDFELYTYEYNRLVDIRSQLSDLVLDKSKTVGDNIVGDIQVKEDGYFVVSIPYDTGYSFWVDGVKTNYEKINRTFMGFKMKAGQHHVEITYEAPLKKVAEMLSVLGILIFLGLSRWKRGKN